MNCKLCGREFDENVSDAVDKRFCSTNCEVFYLGKAPKDPLLIKTEKEEKKREKQTAVLKQREERNKEKEEKRKEVQIARAQKKKERHEIAVHKKQSRHEIAELKKQARQVKRRTRHLNFVSVLQKINLNWIIIVVNYLAMLVFRFMVDMKTESISVSYIIYYILLYIVPIVISIIFIKKSNCLDSEDDIVFGFPIGTIYAVVSSFGFALIVWFISEKTDSTDFTYGSFISIPITTLLSTFICRKKNKIHFSKNMEVSKKIKTIVLIIFLLCLEVIFLGSLINDGILAVIQTIGFYVVAAVLVITIIFVGLMSS